MNYTTEFKSIRAEVSAEEWQARVDLAACRRRGKHCGLGGLATRPDLVAEFVKMGARYVSTGTDLGFLIGACTARASEVKKIKL